MPLLRHLLITSCSYQRFSILGYSVALAEGPGRSCWLHRQVGCTDLSRSQQLWQPEHLALTQHFLIISPPALLPLPGFPQSWLLKHKPRVLVFSCKHSPATLTLDCSILSGNYKFGLFSNTLIYFLLLSLEVITSAPKSGLATYPQ